MRFPSYEKRGGGAEGQTRTVDTGIFSAVLYHLSYLGADFYYRTRRGLCQGAIHALTVARGHPFARLALRP